MVTRIGQRAVKPRRTFFREWRELRGLSQDELAAKLGSTKGAVSKIENGVNRYNQTSLEAWAAALNCDPSDLISRDPQSEDVHSMLARAPQSVKNLVTLALQDALKE